MEKRSPKKTAKADTARRKSGRNVADEDVFSSREEILAAAARLFKKDGYSGVSIRQIADAAGIQSGSLYHHFASKREMYVELNREEMQKVVQSIGAAVEKFEDPWDRLEAAITTHLSMSLDADLPAMLLSADEAALAGEMRAELLKNRRGFDQLYKKLVVDLPLPDGIDRDVLHIVLMSVVNDTSMWYRKGRLSREQVAKHLFRILRV